MDGLTCSPNNQVPAKAEADITVNVSEGDAVTKGQTLMVLEAMKMEIRIQSPMNGTISKLFVKQGETVEREQTLIEIDG
jgi:pyruvate carboxylase subunit B